MSVFVTSYEVNTAGRELIQPHIEAAGDWLERAWVVAKEFGGEGFQPYHSEGIRAVLFKDAAPPGWKVLERDPENRDRVRCAPRKTNKAGKLAAERLRSIGRRPEGRDAAEIFGWNPSTLAMDENAGIIYFPTFQTIELPSPRHFLRLPRFPGDGWPGHDGLTEIPESEYMRAIEAHNAIVRERKLAA